LRTLLYTCYLLTYLFTSYGPVSVSVCVRRTLELCRKAERIDMVPASEIFFHISYTVLWGQFGYLQKEGYFTLTLSQTRSCCQQNSSTIELVDTVTLNCRGFVVQLVPTIVQQLTRFRLTQRVARSVCGSTASCYIDCARNTRPPPLLSKAHRPLQQDLGCKASRQRAVLPFNFRFKRACNLDRR